MVEIAKAFLTERPAPDPRRADRLADGRARRRSFSISIAKLKASGVGIIYVSHRMREIKQIADRITVLRDGRKITTVAAADVSESDLVELMTGRKIDVLFPHIAHRRAKSCSRSSTLTLADRSVNDVSFHARAGEITGIAGLVGCGKSEIVRAIFGLEPIETGTIRVRGKDVASPTPSGDARSSGVCYFPVRPRRRRSGAGASGARECFDGGAGFAGFLPRTASCSAASERRIVQGIVDKLLAAPAADRARGRVISPAAIGRKSCWRAG